MKRALLAALLLSCGGPEHDGVDVQAGPGLEAPFCEVLGVSIYCASRLQEDGTFGPCLGPEEDGTYHIEPGGQLQFQAIIYTTCGAETGTQLFRTNEQPSQPLLI